MTVGEYSFRECSKLQPFGTKFQPELVVGDSLVFLFDSIYTL